MSHKVSMSFTMLISVSGKSSLMVRKLLALTVNLPNFMMGECWPPAAQLSVSLQTELAPHASCELFDPKTFVWTEVEPMNHPRFGHQALLYKMVQFSLSVDKPRVSSAGIPNLAGTRLGPYPVHYMVTKYSWLMSMFLSLGGRMRNR